LVVLRYIWERGGADYIAEFVGATRVLSLEGGESADRPDGGCTRPEEVVVHCHDADLPALMLDLALAYRPCTSLSALQAK
jgi:hypothetical protein